MSDQAAAIVVFDQINAQKGTARVIGNTGAADVMAMQTPKILSLVEFSETGNIVFTSIFTATASKGGHFPAVESRHLIIGDGGVIPQQYYGTCVAQ